VGRSAVHGPIPRSAGLQRFFSTFPGGWPGTGLLLLRAVAGAAALAQGSVFAVHGTASTPATWTLAALAVLSGAGLFAGFLTPAAAAGASLSAIAITAMTAAPDGASMAAHWQGAWFVAADALALAMLGPGALSIDAWLFGRREIVIPDVPRRPSDR
jgi:uncharacterized membrane protein YphA (DoxX/SURF4 family)